MTEHIGSREALGFWPNSSVSQTPIPFSLFFPLSPSPSAVHAHPLWLTHQYPASPRQGETSHASPRSGSSSMALMRHQRAKPGPGGHTFPQRPNPRNKPKSISAAFVPTSTARPVHRRWFACEAQRPNYALLSILAPATPPQLFLTFKAVQHTAWSTHLDTQATLLLAPRRTLTCPIHYS